MATKKNTETEAAAEVLKPSLATVTAVAVALLQSPRFAARICDDAQQELAVRVAVDIATRITAACA